MGVGGGGGGCYNIISALGEESDNSDYEPESFFLTLFQGHLLDCNIYPIYPKLWLITTSGGGDAVIDQMTLEHSQHLQN